MRSDNQKQYTKKPIKIRYGHRPLFSILILSISFLIINLTSNGFHLQLIESVQAEVEPEDLGSGPGRFNSIYAGDIDDDGRAEIVFGNYDGYVTVLEYRRGEFFTEWQSPKTGHRVWGVTVADFYGDSTKEIIIGNGDGDIYAYDAKSHKEVWHTASFGNSELVRDIHGLLVHDLGSNDTRYLLAGTGYKTDQDLGTVFIFGVSDNDTEKVRPIAKIADIDNRLRGIAVGDVDGDGALEIVFGSGVATGENPGKGYVRIYDVKTVLANKDGHPKSEWTSKNLKGDCVAIELADFTGDDIPEIVVGNGYRYQGGWVRVLTYDKAKGDYIEYWKSPDIGPKPYGLAVDDIDDDGKVEIVVGNQPGYVYAYQKQGSSFKLEKKSKLLGSDVLGIDIADIDNDGELEVIAAQGGYVGKGDYTSGYTEPHIYILNGKDLEIEYIIGETSLLGFYLTAALLILIILFLVGLNYYLKFRKRIKEKENQKGVGGS